MSFEADSRPATPDSLMSTSLQRATATIDDLTLALTNFSRVASPDHTDVALCCCGKEDCHASQAWLAWKGKMDRKLILSAEVGQALLERHEAFVRRHESGNRSPQYEDRSDHQVDARVSVLVKENAVLEKRLAQALVNAEMTEEANKRTLQDLQEAQSNVQRLTNQLARSMGWENRLAVALQEKDDLQQERDITAQRAKLADSRIGSLKEKCAKLQNHVSRLQEELNAQRSHRQELSEEVLTDARKRLAKLQQSATGQSSKEVDTDLMKVLESLVADNEGLKRDNAELQGLLADSREDIRGLQEELEERRASGSAHLHHRHTNSSHSTNLLDPSSPRPLNLHVGTMPTNSILHGWHRRIDSGSSYRRASSIEPPSRHPFEPLTPETDRRPLSPESTVPSETKWTSFAHPGYETDDDSHYGGRPWSPERSRERRSLLSLTRSRGVQTDGVWQLTPSAIPQSFGEHISSGIPQDGRSESSSLMDGQTNAISALIERVSMLLNRMTQADALTLTNRLKRQHLQGADVRHLSRTTVNSVLHEATTLRAHFRAFLEDEKAVLTCTRRDLRALFKLFKEMFSELGQLRIVLNDVILDPSCAAKVSEMALNPSKATSAERNNAEASGSNNGSGWMAPISKLFGLPGGSNTAGPSNNAAARTLSPQTRSGLRPPTRVPSRVVPKREAALSASAMTVNVEFSGTAVGRSVTSTYSAHPEREDSISILNIQTLLSQPVPNQDVSRNVMGIFAGAPRNEENMDPWIVIPRPQHAPHALTNLGMEGSATIGRSGLRRTSSRLSRIVDAVIDTAQDERGEEQDIVRDTLLERTLTRRGLSDSSIHSTFMNHAPQQPESRRTTTEQPSGQERGSVLHALSRGMQTFRFAGQSAPPINTNAEAGPSISRPNTPMGSSVVRDSLQTPTGTRASFPRAISPTSGRAFPNLSTWAAAVLDPAQDPASYMAGSPREEPFMHRAWTRERDL